VCGKTSETSCRDVLRSLSKFCVCVRHRGESRHALALGATMVGLLGVRPRLALSLVHRTQRVIGVPCLIVRTKLREL
jgi:hypothetical protein